MRINNLIKSPVFKKGIGIASAVIAGIIAMSDTITEQKRDEEFEEMKKQIKELQKSEEEQRRERIPTWGSLFYLRKIILKEKIQNEKTNYACGY